MPYLVSKLQLQTEAAVVCKELGHLGEQFENGLATTEEMQNRYEEEYRSRVSVIAKV